ncbi:histidine phosphatase family protein [Sulfurirhabdus autotrophica]|uniref:Broad specificity phosphatase PhoE n=1 Tax=Sulfurirhabdus autotrophica TaxID=1706046 RepID=A0A4R3Y9F1_9PROT|nr:histidine phosphatase family protein [Sulfurirhabdus autotrophica]TCV88995.1 broad specificity phosphatase PhoE [Sulfurirhabdus autotrophica]
MPNKTLYFVRHGEADFNLMDRVNAHPEVRNNLTVTGKEQAACCSKELPQSNIDVIYCSEFPRARQTAEIINKRFEVPIIEDSLINETGAFAFEGKPTSAWHAAQVPDRLSAVVPDCESYADMKRRLITFLNKMRSISAEHIVVVSHEEPIQVMVGILTNTSDAEARSKVISHCYPIKLALPQNTH